MKRGKFIVFEGLDGVGKTTQATNLINNINKISPRYIYLHKFPNRVSNTGRKIDAYLKHEIEMSDEEIHCLFSDNRRKSMILLVYLYVELMLFAIDMHFQV